jgi:hypothetical protein
MSDMADVGITPEVDVDDAMDAAADATRTHPDGSEEAGPPLPVPVQAIHLESSIETRASLSEGATERVDVEVPDEGDGEAS